MVTYNNNTMTNNTEPRYTCEVCNAPTVEPMHTHIPMDNSAPMYFCSIGCYYIWAGETYYSDYEDDEYQYL